MRATGQRREAPALTAQWARAHLRDLEDRYACASGRDACDELEKQIVATSLRFGVLCRFTAYVAVDSRVVADGTARHRLLQPVEAPAGWDTAGWDASPLAAMPLTTPWGSTTAWGNSSALRPSLPISQNRRGVSGIAARR